MGRRPGSYPEGWGTSAGVGGWTPPPIGVAGRPPDSRCFLFVCVVCVRRDLCWPLDSAFHLAHEFHRAEDPSQDSLFELMDADDAKATETQLEFPEIRNWPKRERLNQEKAALGF